MHVRPSHAYGFDFTFFFREVGFGFCLAGMEDKKIVSALAWVPKGAAKEVPIQAELSQVRMFVCLRAESSPFLCAVFNVV